MNILIAVAFLGILGLISGIILSFAEKKFEVKVDPKVEEIMQYIPSANCGGCGYPGCAAFSEALVAGKVSISGCVAISKANAAMVNKILGIAGKSDAQTDPLAEKAALIRCQGLDTEEYKNFEYTGVETCQAAVLLQNGPWKCPHRCMGLGSCVAACPFDAIKMGPHHLPIVDEEKCVACGKCVVACPKQIIELAPKIKTVHVLCVSTEVGKDVVKMCKVGCIACGLCKKACPVDAIVIENNLARIDYTKCIDCGKCVTVCPRKTIIKEAVADAKADAQAAEKEPA
jgi:electron transport complex protein RnfB